MKTFVCPVLETERLKLRRPGPHDIGAILRHAGDRRVASKTRAIPHPYHRRDAEEWLAGVALEPDCFQERGDTFTFAIERKCEPGMIGAISLLLRDQGCSAEAGYWLGVPFWRHGFMTEALRELLRHGFEDLGLLYIGACHMDCNPASGRVMKKAGMKFENIIQGGLPRDGVLHDRVNHGLFADEWRELRH